MKNMMNSDQIQVWRLRMTENLFAYCIVLYCPISVPNIKAIDPIVMPSLGPRKAKIA